MKMSLETMNERQWRFHLGSTSIAIREQIERIVQVLLKAKDIVQPAVNIDPIHAGFPLMGACILLQVSTVVLWHSPLDLQ